MIVKIVNTECEDYNKEFKLRRMNYDQVVVNYPSDIGLKVFDKKDVEYISNITFLGDVKILWMTFYKVFKQDDIGIPSVTEEGGLHIIRKVQRPEYLKLFEDDPNMPKFVQGVKENE